MQSTAFIVHMSQIKSHTLIWIDIITTKYAAREFVSTNKQKIWWRSTLSWLRARDITSSISLCTAKRLFWTNLPYSVDKSPMTLRTNIPRKWGQISIENDGFSEITRILLQIQGYQLTFPKICRFLTITIAFLGGFAARQVMEKIVCKINKLIN